MTREQREEIRRLRQKSPLDLGGDVALQRPLFEELLSAHPVPPDIVVDELDLDRVPALSVTVADTPCEGTTLYFHGGAFTFGSARSSLGIVADLARRSRTRVVTVDYRLAPEHPAPAAVDDARHAYETLLTTGQDRGKIVVAGESAGGGVALGLLASLPATSTPAAGVLLSPWVDLTLSGGSMTTRAADDYIVSREALARRVRDYVGDPAAAHRHSPLFERLDGLPPMLIQVGTHEVLLDDATRLAMRLADADVSVILDLTAEVTHVFQAFAPILDEAAAAMNRAAAFIRTAVSPGQT
ncbi:alpha/beta hydrolase [Amycolatopsis cynarae]|uniref:Alpha/beta hydrolase n=1 Tax=Amycolatopsis cynarae TaxID=2995223 RepID=A0ABY7B916_9PSEU|nr:alpha/beta hydrolase [Amycolatopsis sp. HUAS 11-8]WAL67732.1 alpha/beta hydrolase [Amycolatopsis sp. HUAS 11-8]